MQNEFKFYFVIQNNIFYIVLEGKYKGRKLCAEQIDNSNKKLTSLMPRYKEFSFMWTHFKKSEVLK